MTPIVVQLAALPAAYLMWMGWLYVANRRKGLAISIGLFAVAYAIGLWRILSTDAPTAGPRILLLPYEAAVAGVLGLAFAYGWSATSTAARIAGRLCLTAAALLIGAVALG